MALFRTGGVTAPVPRKLRRMDSLYAGLIVVGHTGWTCRRHEDDPSRCRLGACRRSVGDGSRGKLVNPLHRSCIRARMVHGRGWAGQAHLLICSTWSGARQKKTREHLSVARVARPGSIQQWPVRKRARETKKAVGFGEWVSVQLSFSNMTPSAAAAIGA